MTSLEQARAMGYELGRFRTGSAQRMPLGAALGRTLAQPAIARVSVPTTNTSAMDGWVVRGSGPWRITGNVMMGAAPGAPLADGTARAVTTGGAIPPGTTAVLRAERGHVDDDQLQPICTIERGVDIRCAGEEVTAGDAVVNAGTRVTPAVLASAAVAGLDMLSVREAPRAALVLIGSEVIDSGIPRPGQVRDAFGISLPAVLKAYGIAVVDVRHLSDDREAVRAALDRDDVDVIITTGGTGHGSCDHVVPALERLNARIRTRGIDMRPGHPTVLAQLGDVPVLGLPGNPFAAMSALVAVGLPLLAGLLAQPCPAPQLRVAADGFPGGPGGIRLVACREGLNGLTAVRRQGAAMTRGLATADCIALVETSGAPAGDTLRAIPLPWAR